MKKLLLLIQVTLIFLAFFKITPAYGWDTTAAKFYPLNVGNYYVFEDKHLFMQCISVQYMNYRKVTITSDTILSNGKRYFKFTANWWLWNGPWIHQRIDSNTMNVYGFNISTSEEVLLDSLLARKNDTFLGKRNFFAYGPCVVMDTSTQYLLNATRRMKHINSNGSIVAYYSLLEGIGFYKYSDCELGEGNEAVLKGCIINGVLYGDTSVSSVRQISSEIPDKYKLYQNYPNPFNPTTYIKFDIQKTSPAKLIVYDALGREVAALVNEKLSAGSYETSWDGSGYPSGVYFYRLETSEIIYVRKMVMIK